MSSCSSENSQEINLFSDEKLDRSSPNIWPGLHSDSLSAKQKKSNCNGQSRWMSDLSKEDIDILNELAVLSPNQLVDKVKDLMELAYQLSIEEAHQMARGKLLNILDKSDQE